MSYPTIDWANKVNDPDLLAFLQQYGTINYLSAQEINEMRDFVNMLSRTKMDKMDLINPFMNLVIIDKGAQNGVANTGGTTLEINDVVRGFFDKDTYWPAAYYLGGDSLLRSSWKPFWEGISTPLIPNIPNPNPPPIPPAPGTRNFSTNFSPTHFKIFNS